jgi:hypothetical protein
VAKETTKILTQHTGLPPRASDGSNPWDKREQAKAEAFARNQQAAKERKDAAKGKGETGSQAGRTALNRAWAEQNANLRVGVLHFRAA